MPINSDFLIKHVRPVDADAVATLFSDNFTTYLIGTLGLSSGQVANLISAWRTTAATTAGANIAAFETSANAVSQNRWAEHSQTAVNTVFFLNSDQIRQLSSVGNANNRNRTFVADFSHDPIAVAIDVSTNRQGQVVTTPRTHVTGMNVSTDNAGNICHLNPPAPGSAPMAPGAAPMDGTDPATAGYNGVIDLSHNNGAFTVDDFGKAKAAGIRAVFHKATQGTGFADPLFRANLTAARDAGLRIGAYHFGTSADPAAQLAFLADSVAEAGLGAMPLVLDYEGNSTPATSMTLPQVRTFLQQARTRFGAPIGLYSGATVREALGHTPDPLLGESWLWLAAYTAYPQVQASWQEWTLWQYSDGRIGPEPHAVAGFGKTVDRSVFQGSEADLEAFWNKASIMP